MVLVSTALSFGTAGDDGFESPPSNGVKRGERRGEFGGDALSFCVVCFGRGFKLGEGFGTVFPKMSGVGRELEAISLLKLAKSSGSDDLACCWGVFGVDDALISAAAGIGGNEPELAVSTRTAGGDEAS